MTNSQATKVAEALGLERNEDGWYYTATYICYLYSELPVETEKQLAEWLNSPEGREAVRDKVHHEIGGSGYEMAIRVQERGRTDYMFWRIGVTPSEVIEVCMRNRDSREASTDMPKFYTAVLLRLHERGE